MESVPTSSQVVFWSCEDMSSDSVQKFVLKSTTKVSLNERFTNVMMIKQSAPVNITATIRQQHTASARNRRLAQQMENRPSVQAALQQQQSLKQRLGTTNIQARLGRPMGSLRGGGTGQWVPMGGLRGKTRGGIRSRGLRGRCSFDGLGRGWGRGRGRGRGRGQGRGVGRPAVTREQLDNQLDAYMSKSKWYLDAELDAYMAQTDPEGLV